MTWTRLSDDFFDRPHVLSLSRSARLLHVEALVWCNRALTDGRVPVAALHRLTDSPELDADLAELQAAELWKLDEDEVWLVDWTDQESAETVRKRQAVSAAKQQRYRDRVAKHAAGDDSLCDPRFCKRRARHDAGDHSGCIADWCQAVRVTRNETSNETGGVTSPQPVPAQPTPARPEDRGRVGVKRPDPCQLPGHNGTVEHCRECASERLAAG